MPCTQNGGPFGIELDQLDAARAQVHNLIIKLCSACKAIENSNAAMPMELRDWWDNHKKVTGHEH